MAFHVAFVIILLQFFWVPHIVLPQEITFDEVKNMLTQKHYEMLVQVLQKQPLHNSARYLLIAYCYEKLGNQTLARVYFAKSFQVGSYRERLKIFEKLKQFTNFYRIPFVGSGYAMLYCGMISIPMVLLQCIFLILISLLLYIVRYWYYALFLSIILVTVVYGMVIQYQNARLHAVTLKDVVVYSVPENNSPSVGIIEENSLVYYTETSGNFYKVETEEKKRGWIAKDEVIEII